jgi:hypothetical protein
MTAPDSPAPVEEGVANEPECPGTDCPMCSGEACNKCGAGCWNNSAPHCDHASDERHDEPAPTAPPVEDAGQAAREYLARTRVTASELDTLRGRVGQLEAEVAALTVGRDDWRLLAEGRAVDLVTVTDALGETRSQLESAQRACEASRLRLVALDDSHTRALGLADRNMTANLVVANRIAGIVASHIVKTSEAEPALEGLGRIEGALVEGGKAREEVKRLKEASRKLKVQQRALEQRIDPVVARQDTMMGRLERERMRTALAMWDSSAAAKPRKPKPGKRRKAGR